MQPRCAGLPTLLATGLLALSGCAVGPAFQPPAPPATTRYTPAPLPASIGKGAGAQRLVPGADVPEAWWTSFGSPALDRLVARALATNPDLAAATAALRVAKQNLAAGRGPLYPSIDVGFSSSRQRTAGTLASPLASNADWFTLHTAEVDVAWAPDLFGGARDQLAALRAAVDVQRFQLEAARLSIAANVVLAAVNEAGLRAQLTATRNTIGIQRDTLESLQRQLALGAVPAAAVVAQRAALAQARGTLPPLQKQLDQQRDALAALLGTDPAHWSATRFNFANLRLPQELPVSLPAQLVERRPDVRVAEAELRAASALVGVAIANRLPKFTLSASTGSAPTDIASLFAHGTLFWGIAADIAEPVFQAGSLAHQQRAAEASFDEAKAQYRATVIAALQNVADTLYALQRDDDALRAAEAAARATTRSLAISRAQLRLGDIDYLAVLQAGQQAQQTSSALAAARANRYGDTVALFQALGGGWQPDTPRHPHQR